MKELDKLPNFFMVGAMKSGTTSLYHIMSEHQDVYFPTVKEPHYFMDPGNKLFFHGPGDQGVADLIFIGDKERYTSLYKDVNQKIQGDASAMYLYSETSPDNIRKHNKNPYILIVLRNPVDRAYSSFLHLRRDYRETLDFRSALEEEDSRIQMGYNPIWHYKKAGLYSEQVQRYFDRFEKVKVIIYDDLIANPSDIVEEVCSFLSIDNSDKLNIDKKYNVSGVPKSKLLHQVLRKPHPIKKLLKKMVPHAVRSKIKNAITNQNLTKAEPIPEDCKVELYEYFKNDILRLEEVLNRDLSKWKNS